MTVCWRSELIKPCVTQCPKSELTGAELWSPCCGTVWKIMEPLGPEPCWRNCVPGGRLWVLEPDSTLFLPHIKASLSCWTYPFSDCEPFSSFFREWAKRNYSKEWMRRRSPGIRSILQMGIWETPEAAKNWKRHMSCFTDTTTIRKNNSSRQVCHGT